MDQTCEATAWRHRADSISNSHKDSSPCLSVVSQHQYRCQIHRYGPPPSSAVIYLAAATTMKSKAERSQIDTLLPQDRAAHPHTHTPLCNHMYVSYTHLTDSQRDPRLILKSLHSFGRFFQHLTQQENRGGYEWLMDKNTDRFAFPACSARAHTHTHTHTQIFPW